MVRLSRVSPGLLPLDGALAVPTSNASRIYTLGTKVLSVAVVLHVFGIILFRYSLHYTTQYCSVRGAGS